MKYKKCCGAGEPVQRGRMLKPVYTPGVECDPAYWRALKAARNRFAMPTVVWEDPRTIAAMLGLAQRPGSDPRRPPVDEDFDALIERLEHDAIAESADVWMRAAAFGDELVSPSRSIRSSASVPVELDNAVEYRLAEEDVIAWLRTQPLDLRTLEARVAAALRAEQLARLNYLRRLAARGKLRAVIAWIEDFVASGEPLVVFAHHREVQHALIGRFPGAAHVLGGDDLAARAAAVDEFQRPDGPSLIVCSMQAASQGITLVRASNVAFVELDWTPARHDQAEDRCHRIGQRDAVTAYYLLASETIDEQMATVLQHKRAVIAAVTDGHRAADTSALDAVVAALRERSAEAIPAAA